MLHPWPLSNALLGASSPFLSLPFPLCSCICSVLHLPLTPSPPHLLIQTCRSSFIVDQSSLLSYSLTLPLATYPRPLAMSITRVPLSTVFTAPASCSSSWTYEASTYNGASSGLLLQNAEGNFLDTNCFPPGFLGAGRLPASQVFSPGACPDGYVTQSPILVNGGVTTASCCSQ